MDVVILALDGVAAGCDMAVAGIAFLSKTSSTAIIFAGCTSTSKFARTLRNKCKEMESSLFGCK
jgi:predicted phosphoribosyltransferase